MTVRRQAGLTALSGLLPRGAMLKTVRVRPASEEVLMASKPGL